MYVMSKKGGVMGTTLFKKTFAFVLSLAVMLSCLGMPVHAAELDKTLTVKKVEAGATVKGYRIVSEDNGKWVVANTGVKIENPSQPTAKEIFDIAKNETLLDDLQKIDFTPNSSGDYVASNPSAGIYLVLVTPQAGSTGVYTPMIVSADYVQDKDGDKSSVLDVEGKDKLTIGSTTYAKKSKPTVSKTFTKPANSNVTGDAANSGTNKIGDVIDFKINTAIPLYTSDYTNPKFDISDTLSKGLKLKENTVKVYNGEVNDNNLIKEYSDYTDGSGGNVKKKNYEITYTADKAGFKISFTKDYLLSNADKSNINVTYKAELVDVVGTSTSGFEPNTNKAEIDYSTSPKTNDGKDTKKTNHYTFDINGNVGTKLDTTTKKDEIIKVGVDVAGNTQMQIITEESVTSEVGKKAGAKFRLYKKDNSIGQTAAAYKKKENKLLVKRGVDASDSDKIGAEAVTGDDGKIRFKGIDAGKYVLVETQAPTGYAKNETVVPVVVSATLNDDGELTSYSVKINNTEAATYVATYEDHKVKTITGEYKPLHFNNYKLGTLPSTGGIGTYLFYIVGTALLAFAVVMIIKKKRNNRVSVK